MKNNKMKRNKIIKTWIENNGCVKISNIVGEQIKKEREKKALEIAEQYHKDQMYGSHPYIFHIKQVKGISEYYFHKNENIILGSILHDTLEDTSLKYNDIENIFGERVAELVFLVTDEEGKNRKERKNKTYLKLKGNWEAIAIKLCDRLANIRNAKETNNSKIYKMYLKEHNDFKEYLYDKSHYELESIWNDLEMEFTNK